MVNTTFFFSMLIYFFGLLFYLFVKDFVKLLQLDDWVLCRIYKKTNVVHPIATIPSDQEEEEQFIQESLLPCLKGDQENSLKPQKSSSFSNLLDAMDYSLLSSFLSDCPSSSIGFDHSISTGFNNSGIALDQSFFINGGSSSSSSNYVLPNRLPQLQFPAPTSVENRLKRQLSSSADDQQDLLCPPKKCMTSCSFINNSIQSDNYIPQNNLMNQLFSNQQFFLSPELQFHG